MERGKLRMQKAISRSALVQMRAAEIAEQIKAGSEELDAFVDLGGDLEEESAAYLKRRTEYEQSLAEVVARYKKLTQVFEKVEAAAGNKKLRKRWSGKFARARIEVSQSIRKIPFYISQWKQFAKEIERAAEELAHLEQELRKLDGRNSPSAQTKGKEIKREIRKREQAAGATLPELRHILSVIRHGEIEAERAKKRSGRGQPAIGGFRRQEIRQPRPSPSGSDPGGQHRLNARRR
jgi:RNA polymerase primary sigma factor